MNEDFVTYEIAKKLKEEGFNEPCYGYYHLNGGDDSFELCGNDSFDFLNSLNSFRIAAPTISQVLKWLRDEKKIYISIEPHSNDDFLTKIMWTWDAAYISDCKFQWYDGEFGFDTYENAAVSAIENVLNNLI